MAYIYVLNFPAWIIRHQVFSFFNLIYNAKNHALYTQLVLAVREHSDSGPTLCQRKYAKGYWSKTISLEYNDDAQCHENFTFLPWIGWD